VPRIECSVWNNGGTSWGLRVLGGPRARATHFHRNQKPILVELDGVLFPVNIDKKSFWIGNCGELISVALRDWIMKNLLTTGDRVWLEVVVPFHTFKAVAMQVALPAKEIA
jgi:hypothetical protein